MKKQTLLSYSFFPLAVLLAAFGVMSIFRVSPNPEMKTVYLVYAALMMVDALALLLCGLLIQSGKAAVFWLSASLVSLNILLPIFDQFGWIDLLFVLLNMLTLGLLLSLRGELLPQ
jgi:uncharacterized membrane protein YgdD (TMEM256/DUF423 family)